MRATAHQAMPLSTRMSVTDTAKTTCHRVRAERRTSRVRLRWATRPASTPARALPCSARSSTAAALRRETPCSTLCARQATTRAKAASTASGRSGTAPIDEAPAAWAGSGGVIGTPGR